MSLLRMPIIVCVSALPFGVQDYFLASCTPLTHNRLLLPAALHFVVMQHTLPCRGDPATNKAPAPLPTLAL
jgi:hypothetical protein